MPCQRKGRHPLCFIKHHSKVVSCCMYFLPCIVPTSVGTAVCYLNNKQASVPFTRFGVISYVLPTDVTVRSPARTTVCGEYL